jgi:hypothetical protein
MCDIVMHLNETCIVSTYFGGSPVGEVAKTSSAKKTNHLTDEYNEPHDAAGRLRATIYSSVNRRI